MNCKGASTLHRRIRSYGAFTVVELIAIVATLLALAGLLLPAVAKSRSHTHATIDLSNVHQILGAVQIYAAGNSDYCPAPGWGTTTKSWLYSAGIPSGAVPSSASHALIDQTISNQVVYFIKGELASYLENNQKILDCPTDVAMRRSGTYKAYYAQRGIKLASYNFTGAVSGFGAPRQAPNANAGGTFKLGEFHPTSFLLREPDETVPFNFNDGSDNQEDAAEGVSRRHTASPPNPAQRSIADGAMVGTFGGGASYINPKRFTQLRTAPAENDLRCGPGYR